MRASAVDIKNFRRFDTFHCELHPNLTLLMGPNGAGKTSLLRAVSLSLSVLRATNGLNSDQIVEEDVHRVDNLDPAGERWRTPVYPCWVKTQVYIEGQQPMSFAAEKSPSRSSYIVDGDAESQAGFAFAHQASQLWFNPQNTTPIPMIACYGAGRPSGFARPGAIQRLFEKRQDVWISSAGDLPSVSALAQWFQYNELRTLQERQEPTVYRQVRAAVLSAIHAVDIRYVVRDDALMLLHAGEGWRPFQQLSDGQLRIASLFCDLAMRCASLNSHLGDDCIVSTPGIVTIDELDLHLHPRWQREVIPDLRRVFPLVQFVVTSHSPFLLQSAFEFGRVVDMADGGFVEPTDPSIEDITESVMHVNQPQRGKRFLEMKALAQQFYEMLEQPTHSPADESALRQRLDEALAVFANDPASSAWLEQRRLAAGH